MRPQPWTFDAKKRPTKKMLSDAAHPRSVAVMVVCSARSVSFAKNKRFVDYETRRVLVIARTI